MALGRNRSDASRRLMGVVAAAVAAVAVVACGAAPAAASVASEQAKANQLAQQIVADGAAVQQAVAAEDAAQAKVSDLAAEVAATKARLATAERAAARSGRTLKGLLVKAYMDGQDTGGVSTVFDGGSAGALIARAEYSHVAEGDLQVAIDAYRAKEQQAHAEAATLEAQQAQASAAATQLASAGQQAQAALTRDTVLLDQTKNDIAVQQAAAAAQARQEKQQEAALAAQQVQRRLAPAPTQPPVTTPTTTLAPQAQAQAPAQTVVAPTPAAPPTPAATATPTAPAVTATPGGYANPLRSVSGLSPERIDQGVDYSGYGPLYAIGTGVVLNTVNAGWPGGTFITYRLTSGAAAGLVVYAAEDIQPDVQVGQQVTATTVIGTMYEGPDGIETGWADSTGMGYTMAYESGQFGGSNSTAFGANFSQLLASVGAPGGVLQNSPPSGALPANWPSW